MKYRNGFYLNDKVKYNNIDCWVYGFAGGEKGKLAVIRNINGKIMSKNNTHVDTRKVKFICHNNNWQYTILN